MLEHALFGAGIPYRVYGGMRFFERAEVKHALAYLRLIAEPGDDGAFLRVDQLSAARHRRAHARAAAGRSASGTGTTLWQAACSGIDRPARRARRSRQFVQLDRAAARRRRRRCRCRRRSSTSSSSRGSLAHYRNEKDGQDRIENLQELVNAADNFVREARSPPTRRCCPSASTPEAACRTIGENEGATDPLTAFLAHAALEAGDTQAAEGRPALQLMTVHSAKGLEFHTVFVTGLEEGLFPHENSLERADGLEEERRLMYVAITRARRRLYLTFAQSRMLHGQTRYNIQSRASSTRCRRSSCSGCRRSGAARSTSTRRVGLGSAATARTRRRPRRRAPPWRVGQSVRHAKFGVGVIIDAEGRGADARVQVNFRDAGVKWLALEYAKLEAA